jgi:hypothetical protein
MKKLYSAISSLALLLSLPVVAGPLAGKSIAPKTGKNGQTNEINDAVILGKAGPTDTIPPCRGGGGG